MPFARLPIRTACRKGFPLALAAFAAALACFDASAVLYKWVDASGRVSYSDQPPPPGVKAEIVSAPVAPAAGDAVRTMAGQEADMKKRERERADEKKKADKARSDTVQVAQFCTEQRGRLKMYQSGQNLATINEKGEQVFLNAAEMGRERERIEATILERCPG